jgi:hypothetical protein
VVALAGKQHAPFQRNDIGKATDLANKWKINSSTINAAFDRAGVWFYFR